MKISLINHYGSVLKAKRKTSKITQEAAAKEINLSDKSLREIENSKASCNILNYCESLNIDYSKIFEFKFKDKRSDMLFQLILEIEASTNTTF
jgi:DNA-binding XRE family transcriptional regulator